MYFNTMAEQCILTTMAEQCILTTMAEQCKPQCIILTTMAMAEQCILTQWLNNVF